MVVQGYLLKQKRFTARWQRYFFRLEDDQLKQYENKSLIGTRKKKVGKGDGGSGGGVFLYESSGRVRLDLEWLCFSSRSYSWSVMECRVRHVTSWFLSNVIRGRATCHTGTLVILEPHLYRAAITQKYIINSLKVPFLRSCRFHRPSVDIHAFDYTPAPFWAVSF